MNDRCPIGGFIHAHQFLTFKTGDASPFPSPILSQLIIL
ncbi:hypothetical protein NBRC111894_3166 [Sporolactobacillus inulinus]|uniref:Uncharacterized protein n=1 Tax=Sporolactobacillus inulinus TaxID=2078 RepID=A0A4Y1ZEL2_9BACL|nr:hypothetical protein NBRC111894_3166 [Sporolactobacillus inulinus]